MAKNIRTTRETSTGRNTHFKVPGQGEITRGKLVQQIERGKHDDYHIRSINGVKTPVSNPDRSKGNNLG